MKLFALTIFALSLPLAHAQAEDGKCQVHCCVKNDSGGCEEELVYGETKAEAAASCKEQGLPIFGKDAPCCWKTDDVTNKKICR